MINKFYAAFTQQNIIQAIIWLLDRVRWALDGVACVFIGIWLATYADPETIALIKHDLNEPFLFNAVLGIFMAALVLDFFVTWIEKRYTPKLEAVSQ